MECKKLRKVEQPPQDMQLGRQMACLREAEERNFIERMPMHHSWTPSYASKENPLDQCRNRVAAGFGQFIEKHTSQRENS